MSIGLVVGFAQTASPQVRPAPVRVVMPAGGAGKERFETAFVPSAAPAQWTAGWELARGMGAAATPALLELQRREPHEVKGLLYLAACLVSAPGDPAVLASALGAERGVEGRLLTLLFLAMAEEPFPAELVAELHRSRVPIVRLAAALALRHAQPAEEPDRRWYRRGADVGFGAAARLIAPRGDLAALTEATSPSLLLRAELLGGVAPRPSQERLAEPLADLVSLRVGGAELGVAAALRVAAAGDPVSVLDAVLGDHEPQLESLVGFVETRELATALIARGFLDVPPSRLPPAARTRLATAFGAYGRPAEVVAAAGRWHRGDLGAPLCLGLAWQLLRRGADRSLPEDAVATLPALPEVAWVAAAMGVPAPVPAEFADDRELGRALAAWQDARLPRPAAADAVERALWRRGWHPGRTRVEAEGALIRDLLISHSEYARAALRLGASEELYRPGGNVEETFFEVAFWFHRFLMAPGLELPPSRRLR